MGRNKLSRLFILDPVCAQVLGHNLTSLVKFREYLKSVTNHDEIICVASKLLPSAEARKHLLKQDFGFYYLNRINILNENGSPVADASVRLPEYEAIQQESANSDMDGIFERYKIGQSDSLFFPSVDFCSCAALFKKLRDMPLERTPAVFLRFIGVMEYANSTLVDPKRELVRQISDLISRGYRINISAESAVYADKLADEIGSPVAATPVPPDHQLMPPSDAKDFCVISPGSGRVDKGFNLLPDIVAEYRRRYKQSDVRFVIQNLPMWELQYNMKSASQLYAAPGVELLPASVSFEDMENIFRRSHLVLMPYASDIYALRSSAILTEAVGYGRQIVTSKGTGFELEVSYFGIGCVCGTVSEYVDAIHQASKLPRQILSTRAKQARYRYSSYCFSQYKGWFS